jgi:FAD/FMN-containing dehydrogenase
MIPDTVIQELSSIVGPEHLTPRHDDLTKYSSDATKLEFMPDAVAFPGDAEEISRILLLANREYFPVIPRGAGSGASGGALPVKGGLVLAMDRFNRILSMDQDNLIIKVEPGVITAHLQEEVENAHAAVKDLFGKVIEMGGTISGEHGIGITKAPYMEMEISGPALELMRRLKKAFDPNGILNPGKIFPNR